MRIRGSVLVAVLGLVLACCANAHATAYINEFHYDNVGTDANEFIEVVLDGGTAAGDVTVSLYNGSDGMYYSDSGTPGQDIFNVGADFTFNGTLGDGKDYYTIMLPVNGLQNGAPDAIAIDIGGTLVEFLSYEGTFTGVGGPADGVLSVDIGADEQNPIPTSTDASVQRIGFGSTWVTTLESNTKGAINVPEPATLALLALGGASVLRRRR